jgi:hypothetical protein
MTPEDRFAELVTAVSGYPGVSVPDGSGASRFGSSALKVDGSIFAMLMGGALVVKLPRDRVAACIASGTGGPFGAGRGTPMKEWLTVVGDDLETWLELTLEALDFVGSPRRV